MLRLAPLAVIVLVFTRCASSEPAGQGVHHGDMHHRFDDVERWAQEFDAPERDAWQMPDVIVKRLVPRKDMTIVDLGAGTGYFTLRFARAVPDGEVVAVDIERSLLAYLEQRAAEAGLANVRTWLTLPEEAGLDDWHGQIDLVFVCDTYHHIADRPAYFANIAHVIKRDGRVVIVDFRPDSERGPPREHKVSIEKVTNEMAEAGLVLVGRYDDLPDQYLLEFQKK